MASGYFLRRAFFFDTRRAPRLALEAARPRADAFLATFFFATFFFATFFLATDFFAATFFFGLLFLAAAFFFGATAFFTAFFTAAFFAAGLLAALAGALGVAAAGFGIAFAGSSVGTFASGTLGSAAGGAGDALAGDLAELGLVVLAAGACGWIAGIFTCVCSAKTAPFGSASCAMRAPPGTVIGPFSRRPPDFSAAAIALSRSATSE